MGSTLPQRAGGDAGIDRDRFGASGSPAKSPTGISGLDLLTFGGLPRHSATVVCGRNRSGKTIVALEFLVHGCARLGERGLFVTFDESVETIGEKLRFIRPEITDNRISRRLSVIHVGINRNRSRSTASLPAISSIQNLFTQIAATAQRTNVARVAIDGLERFLAPLAEENMRRSLVAHLFRVFESTGISLVVTARRGDGQHLSVHGVGEFAARCVLLLDSDVNDPSTHSVRVVKYAGSHFVKNTGVFTIGAGGIATKGAVTRPVPPVPPAARPIRTRSFDPEVVRAIAEFQRARSRVSVDVRC